MGGIEIASYVLLHNKLSRVAATTADLTTRTPQVTEADLQQILNASATIALPYSVDLDGAVVISSITADADTSASRQSSSTGSGPSMAPPCPSRAKWDQRAGPPICQRGFDLRPTQNIIVVEVFFDYEPMLFGRVTDVQQIYHRSIVFPRAGALSSIAPPPTT